MATTSERQERYRLARLASGSKRECFWLEAVALSVLAQLRSIHPGTTRDQIVNQALIALLDSNSPLEDNATNPLATNSNAPADRAELAAIAREWRCEGLTLEQVATRLNEAGWTPSAIPAKRTTGDAWSGKSIAQLLNRDCKSD